MCQISRTSSRLWCKPQFAYTCIMCKHNMQARAIFFGNRWPRLRMLTSHRATFCLIHCCQESHTETAPGLAPSALGLVEPNL